MKFFIRTLVLFTLLIFNSCYNFLPVEEIDNGNPNIPATWKLYSLRWKAGTNPSLENELNKYYTDCNPGCVYEYVLLINLLNESDIEILNAYRKSKNKYSKTIKANSLFLTEIDTCGNNNCEGTTLYWYMLSGDVKGLINSANAIKIRIPANLNETADKRTWKYFKIEVKTNDDPLFTQLQNELYIEPILESFTLVVNIFDQKINNQFLIIGDESDPSASRYSWNQLSKKTREGLINWDKKNKVNLNNFRIW
ncbi:MAG: hypothetical protein IT280_04760 [Ignavibacteria bacterium]|nr:hypothetical protein [Ignavibacteria bacterium]